MKVYFVSVNNRKNINKKDFEKYRKYLENILEELYIIYVRHRDSKLKEISKEVEKLRDDYKMELERYRRLVGERKQMFEQYAKLKVMVDVLRKLYNLVKLGKVSDKYKEKLLNIIDILL